jgi:hypothetical protein
VNGFRKAAQAASKDLNNFKLAWQSEETQTIFKRSKESYEKDHDLSAASRVPKFGWSSHSQLPDTIVHGAELHHGANLEAEQETSKQALDTEKILEDFRNKHTDFVVSTESNNQIIKVCMLRTWFPGLQADRSQIQFKVPSMTMKFTITRRKGTNDKESLEVECVGNMRLFSAITRCIAARPHPDDLRYVLVRS